MRSSNSTPQRPPLAVVARSGDSHSHVLHHSASSSSFIASKELAVSSESVDDSLRSSIVTGELVRVERGNVGELTLWAVEHAQQQKKETSNSSSEGKGLVLRDGHTMKKLFAWKPKPSSAAVSSATKSTATTTTATTTATATTDESSALTASSLCFVPPHGYHRGAERCKCDAAVWTVWHTTPMRRAPPKLIIFDAVERAVLKTIDIVAASSSSSSAAPRASSAPREGTTRRTAEVGTPSSGAASARKGASSPRGVSFAEPAENRQPPFVVFSSFNHRVYALFQDVSGAAMVVSLSPHPPYRQHEAFKLPFPFNNGNAVIAHAFTIDSTGRIILVVSENLHCLVVQLALPGAPNTLTVVRTFRPRDFASVSQTPKEVARVAEKWFYAESEGHVILPEFFPVPGKATTRASPSRSVSSQPASGGGGAGTATPSNTSNASPQRRSTPDVRRGSGGAMLLSTPPSRSTSAASTVPHAQQQLLYQQQQQQHNASFGDEPSSGANATPQGPLWYKVHRAVSKPADALEPPSSSVRRSLQVTLWPSSGTSSTASSVRLEGQAGWKGARDGAQPSTAVATGASMGPFFGHNEFIRRAIHMMATFHEQVRRRSAFQQWLALVQQHPPLCVDVIPNSSECGVVVAPVSLLFDCSECEVRSGELERAEALLRAIKAARCELWLYHTNEFVKHDEAHYNNLLAALQAADHSNRVITHIISFPVDDARRRRTTTTMAQELRVVFRHVPVSKLLFFAPTVWFATKLAIFALRSALPTKTTASASRRGHSSDGSGYERCRFAAIYVPTEECTSDFRVALQGTFRSLLQLCSQKAHAQCSHRGDSAAAAAEHDSFWNAVMPPLRQSLRNRAASSSSTVLNSSLFRTVKECSIDGGGFVDLVSLNVGATVDAKLLN